MDTLIGLIVPMLVWGQDDCVGKVQHDPNRAGQHPVVIDDRAYISLVYWCRGIKGVEEW